MQIPAELSHVTVTQLAAARGVSEQTIRNWMREKKILAPERIGGRFLWTAEQARRILADQAAPSAN